MSRAGCPEATVSPVYSLFQLHLAVFFLFPQSYPMTVGVGLLSEFGEEGRETVRSKEDASDSQKLVFP